MNLKSLTKFIPPPMLAKLLKKHLIPSITGLINMAKDGTELQPGEAEIQIIMITRPGDPDKDIPAMNYAIVVALDKNLVVTRHIKKYNLDQLVDQIDPKILQGNGRQGDN